jgi:hypothetical protein
MRDDDPPASTTPVTGPVWLLWVVWVPERAVTLVVVLGIVLVVKVV